MILLLGSSTSFFSSEQITVLTQILTGELTAAVSCLWVYWIFGLVMFIFFLEFLGWVTDQIFTEFKLALLLICRFSQLRAISLGLAYVLSKKIVLFSPAVRLTSHLYLLCFRWNGSLLASTQTSHNLAKITMSAYYAVYADSGAWDTCLLLAFDKLFRSIFIFTLLPLTENNLIEKLSVKLYLEFVSAKQVTLVKKNFSLGSILYNLCYSLAFVFVFTVYGMLCSL